jgi:uncharacterized membrane protein (UPF0127 family)
VRTWTLALALLLAAACGNGDGETANPFPALETRTIAVDDERLQVAVAESPGSRNRGLSGVASLGSLDGMLFEYETEVDPAAHPFWMRDMQFPLDIDFFDADGRLVDRVRLDPCDPGDDCPRHVARSPFRWVLETMPGRLELTDESRLTLPATSFVPARNH